MLNKLVSIILAVSLIVAMPIIALGDSQPNPGMASNNTAICLSEEIFINEEGQVMYPLRTLVEQLDYSLTWNNENQSIMLSKGNDNVSLKIGVPNVTVNEESIIMHSNPVIKKDTTFVPIEFFSNALNLIIEWDNKQQILKINQSKENTESFFTMSNDETIQNELDTYMKALQKHQNFHGSVLVTKDGKVLLDQGYGFTDLQQNTTNKPQTKFAIGSMTKQFTAIAIMQLNEKGLIDVEDKLSKYFPDFPNGDLITIHNLLTHTSGLENYTNLNEFLVFNSDNQDPMAVINLIKDMPLKFKPGEEFSYSNTNYVLLGIIVEKIANMSLKDYLQENIFDPLNMTNTGIFYGDNNNFCGTTPYSGFLEVAPIDDNLVLSQAYGAGSIYSTVEDLYRWDRALKTEQLVKKQTIDKIFTEQAAIPQVGSYGYGWMIADTPIGKQIWHNGNTFGFTANIAKYPDEDITIIVLTNNGYYDTMALTNVLTSIALNKDYEMPEILEEIEIDDPNLYDSYVGKYDFLPGTNLNIIEKDNKLYAQVTSQNAFEIFPQTNNKFFAKQVDVRIKFINNDKGEVTGLIFKQLGAKFVCQRTVEKVVADVDPIIYDEYVGEYELAPNIIITITKEDDKIYAQLTGQDKYEIFPMSESKYFYKIVAADITFVKDDNGQVTNLILHQNGQDMPALKIK